MVRKSLLLGPYIGPIQRSPGGPLSPEACHALFCTIGAIGALLNIVHQPRTLLVRGLNAGMGTAAGADELVEIPTDASA